MPPASADACQRIIPSNLDADEDSGATAVAIVAPDAVSRVWSPALDEFIASSCALGNDSQAETVRIGHGSRWLTPAANSYTVHAFIF